MDDLSILGKNLFYEALEVDPERRDEFVRDRCGDNGELRQLVELLIEAHESAGSFLAKPALAEPTATPKMFDDRAGPHLTRTHMSGESTSPRVRTESPLPKIPGYDILGEIARGGMGIVYLARHHGLDRLVALKTLSQATHDEEWRMRFRREARALARLRHPNIVQVHDVGEHEGLPFLTLELVEGGTLSDRLRDIQEPAESAELIRTLAQAVATAHELGIIHRDLKPANVLLTKKGEPKITDFGLAKNLEDDGHTRTGLIMGTPSYMAPEQALGRSEIAPAVDVYALGAVLYECLTGRPPFQSASSLETIELVRRQEPVSPRRLRPSLSKDLETICLKCLEKHSAKRYASAEALAADLDRYLEGKPIEARPVGWLERGWRWCRRNPVVALLAALLFVALSSGIVGTTLALLEARSNAERATRNLGEAVRQSELAKAREREANAFSARLQGELERRRRLLASVQVNRAQSIALFEPMRAFDLLHDYESCPIDLRTPAWNLVYHVCRPDEVSFVGHEGGVLCSDFAPDGSIVATGGEDGFVRLWDPRTGRSRGRLGPKPYPIRALTFESDGSALFAGGGNIKDRHGEIVGWDVKTRKEKFVSKKPVGVVHALDFSSTDKTLASLGARFAGGRIPWVTEVTLWNADLSPVRDMPPGSFGSGRTARPRTLGREISSFCVKSLRFDPSGERLATAQGNLVELWEVETGKPSATLGKAGGVVDSVRFSPDGAMLASSESSGRVHLYDVRTGEEQALLQHGRSAGIRLAFTPDGEHLVATRGAWIDVWNIRSRQRVLGLARQSGSISSLCFDPLSGRLFSTAGAVGDRARGKDGRALSRRIPLDFGAEVISSRFTAIRAAALSPTNSVIALIGKRNNRDEWRLRLLDWRTGEPQPDVVRGMREVDALAFSRKGDRLALAARGRVMLWDVPNRRPLTEWPIGFRPPGDGPGNSVMMRFLPDGNRLALAQGKRVVLWDVRSGQRIAELGSGTGHVFDLDLDPQGRYLVLGGIGAPVEVWDIAKAKLVRTLPTGKAPVGSVAFGPDGESLMVANTDGDLALWQVDSWKKAGKRIPSIRRGVFSPDGKNLAVSLVGGRIELFDPTTLVVDASLERERVGAVRRLEFTYDGSRLCLVEGLGRITLWNTQPVFEYAIFRHDSTVQAIAFSSDGQWLRARTRLDGAIYWETKTGRRSTEPPSVRFSAAGPKAASNNLEAEIEGFRVVVRRRWSAVK